MAKRIDLWADYGDWLLDRVDFHRSGCKRLMNYLHNYDFRWSIFLDKNRAADGMDLRFKYARDLDISNPFGRPCSVLEMLVGLALRLEQDYIGDPTDPNPGMIFNEMLENLGVFDYSGRRFNPQKLDEIMDIWLDREFDDDGKGSIFIVKTPENPLPDLEIWRQAMAYIHENSSRFI